MIATPFALRRSSISAWRLGPQTKETCCIAPTGDFGPIVRAIAAANPDLLYVAAYPPDSAGFIRTMHEVGFKPKLFGGFFIGIGIAGIKMQLGSLMNGIVEYGALLPTPQLMRRQRVSMTARSPTICTATR